ncbi:hypothetical protein [Robertkochia flava]|uniref:hypothetical protein n=1 Tax=Robertkochia flava TaxID=3447986 RepID=UPI001CCDA75C|nr:hypothetical protein [Robertkochia marina]
MNTSNNRKEIDLKKAEVLHRDAGDWLSEMEFMNNEMEFFGEMLRNYFMALAEKNFEQEKVLIKNRRTISNEIELMKQRVKLHHDRLIRLIDESHRERSERELEAEHYEVALNFKKLRKEFISYKKDLYDTITVVMKGQKQKSLTS